MGQSSDLQHGDRWRIRERAKHLLRRSESGVNRLALHETYRPLDHMLRIRAGRGERDLQIAANLFGLRRDISFAHDLTGIVHRVLATHIDRAVRALDGHDM